MPLSVGQVIPVPKEDLTDVLPDVKTSDGKPLVFAPTIATEMPLVWPANFEQLPQDEQQALRDKYRFGGIRLRSDIRDKTIPITRQTMDIP